ncbi:MAG: uridine diphosphate-N-acetylglucosamine-binding protein YvcK [Candidatus Omnitrophica bacterium]|nr:uridine diphosphate-N-acetylglucosamine-binding protein YvcK [Candidatus Omnitrophota bacterium]
MRLNVLVVGGEDVAADLSLVFSRLKAKVRRVSGGGQIRQALRASSPTVIFDADFYAAQNGEEERILGLLQKSKKDFIVVSSRKDPARILALIGRGAADYILKPYNTRELIMRFNAVRLKKIRIACLGGGTGLFTLLLGLKALPNALLTSIVSMSDDGGSSGKLSQQFGILPPGDVRRSLVALSNAPEVMNQIMQHRFNKGGELHGHSFGNIFLTVLAEVKGSMSEAVKTLSDILNIQGIVLPATRTPTCLVAQFENGKVIRGESRIDVGAGRGPELRIRKLWHEPEPESDADAFASILAADFVILGPGDLYTSVITNLALKNIRLAVTRTRAKKIYICNLMTKPGETARFDALDHVKEILKYLGRDALDRVLISDSELSEESAEEYSKKNQFPVAAGDLKKIRKITHAGILLADVGNQTELVRHDSVKLRREIEKIIEKEA